MTNNVVAVLKLGQRTYLYELFLNSAEAINK